MIAAVIRELVAAGVQGDDLVAAVARIEASISTGIPVDAAAEKRRAYDRQRKRKARGIPPDSTGIPPETQNAPLILVSSTSGGKKESKEKRVSKNGTGIPPDWQPTEGHFREGLDWGFTREEIIALGEDLRLWAEANSNRAVARKSNWDLAFTGWIRREAQKRGMKKFKPADKPDAGKFYAKLGSPEFEAWAETELKIKGKRPPTDRNGGWWFASRWPPDYPFLEAAE